MGLVSPDYGTIFWMVLAFSIVFFILKRFAWGPILKMLQEREQSIDQALKAADQAREEMTRLKAGHEELLLQSRAERDILLAEARRIREQMIEKAHLEAAAESSRLLEQARNQIGQEKSAAINEIRLQVADLSLEIAEKILRRELADRQEQESLIREELRDLKLN
ncbi:MAG: F0F1 ATP synthase subunit B [Bacteroidales bacterium]